MKEFDFTTMIPQVDLFLEEVKDTKKPFRNYLTFRKGGKFKFSAQGGDLAPFVGNMTKVKIPSEIKPPLYYSL